MVPEPHSPSGESIMVARIHFDIERTVAKFRLGQKLRGRVHPPSGAAADGIVVDRSTPTSSTELPVAEARTSFDDIERRLTRRLFI